VRQLDPELTVIYEVEVEVTLRPTVNRPVCFGVGHPSGTRDQFFFLLEIFFRQLHVCYFVAPSLTRRPACNLLYNCFCSFPEQSLLCRSPAELPYFTVSFETPPAWRARSPIYIPQEQGDPAIPQGTGLPFFASYDSQGLRWRYSNPAPHGEEWEIQFVPHRNHITSF
jgi:hypothetical protein